MGKSLTQIFDSSVSQCLLEANHIEVATNHKRGRRKPLKGDTNTVDIEGRNVRRAMTTVGK